MNFIYEVGKEIISPMIGLFLDGKVVPHQSKGTVYGTNHEDCWVGIHWQIDEERVITHVPFNQYKEMIDKKVLDYLENYIEIPPSKFEVGDIVTGLCVSGIIRKKEYSGVNKRWTYRVISAEGVLSDDYDLRYETEDEEDLKLTTKVTAESFFKDSDYVITIEKKTETSPAL